LTASNDAARWLLEQLRFDRVGQDLSLSNPPDWEQVVAVARQERLAALLLDCAAAAVLPEDARVQLEEIRFQTRVHNALLLMQLEKWLARFEAEHIPAIALKGAALIASVYERTTLRPMSDVDVLVSRADFERAGQLLLAAGFTLYREVTGDTEPTIRTQTLWLPPKLPGGIELHWHLVDSGYYANRVPIEWFWEHTLEARLDAQRVRVFAPEAQLLHLAAHLELHHAGVGWLWLYDVALLIHKFGGALDWKLIVDTAERFEWGQSLRIALARAQATFGVVVPEHVNVRLAALRATRQERLARILAEPTAHQAAFLFDGFNQGDWRARVRYLWRALFPAAEFMRVHGPIRNRRDLAWQYLLRLGRGMYRIPRALWAGMAQLWRAAR
jgi:hypothetical protein